ncbi:MAG: hypothetical protein CMJ31_07510 [Phycisphaerae bacterium]|nr:hypothetical protein [Phycisphaerae bacterium]
MSLDLTTLLQNWPYESGRLNVRMIRGDDGEPKIQVRLDLGILQMNMEGRPDGQTPFGFPSLLEYHENRLDEIAGPSALGPAAPEAVEAMAEGDDEDADAPPAFALSPDECKQLRDEAAQYYHRYVALLVLEDYEGVIRDTTRNLRLLDFCAEHAENDSDGAILEQVRPYITMMRARALASQAIKDNEPNVAVNAIDEGLDALRAHYEAAGDPGDFEQSNEAQMLRSMRETLLPKLPVSQRAELRQRLQEALARENYELAAILRDELRLLPD